MRVSHSQSSSFHEKSCRGNNFNKQYKEIVNSSDTDTFEKCLTIAMKNFGTVVKNKEF